MILIFTDSYYVKNPKKVKNPEKGKKSEKTSKNSLYRIFPYTFANIIMLRYEE